MQIIGELSNTADLKRLYSIYRSGNKVALSFDEDTRLGDVCSILLSEGYEPEDFREDCLKEGFKLIGESLYICRDFLAIVDSISVDENLGALKPFAGMLEDVEYLFIWNGTVFNRVVEVNGNIV